MIMHGHARALHQSGDRLCGRVVQRKPFRNNNQHNSGVHLRQLGLFFHRYGMYGMHAFLVTAFLFGIRHEFTSAQPKEAVSTYQSYQYDLNNMSHVDYNVSKKVPMQARHLTTLPVDPDFARYLNVLQKKKVNSLTGRQFLSHETDGELMDAENESIDDDDEDVNDYHDGTSKGLRTTNGEMAIKFPNMVRNGHNITRVSRMLLRVLVSFKIRSMVDVPCRAHSVWMGSFLKGVSPRLGKPFIYYCVDTQKGIVQEAEQKLPDIDGVNGNFIQRRFWELPLPPTDLVFCWEGLQQMSVAHVHHFLKHIAKGGHHRFVLIGSSPSVQRNTDGSGLNVRRTPFSYGMPIRIFKELAVNQSTNANVKDMYLYTIRGMKGMNHKK